MTSTKLDSIITGDLAALGAQSRQNMPSIDESLATVDRGAYRDGTPGAEARRDKLLATRRLELAMMPLATGRVFVHRVARTAAGATAAIGAMFLLILVYDPMLARMAKFFIPDLSLTLVAAGLLACVFGAYLIAGFFAERVFDSRMRRALETGGDAFEDLDALARGPLVDARELCRKVDGWSTALPLIGLAACAPLFAFLALSWSPHVSWAFSSTLVIENLGFILFATTITSVLAILVGRACQREHRELVPSVLLRITGHWSVIPVSIVSGLLVLAFLGSALTGFSVGHAPSEAVRTFIAVGGTLAALAPVAWVALLIRRNEEKRFEALDG